MNCEVQSLKKNIRYRILVTNGNKYILDMGRSFWKVLFPFAFWIFPNTIFKIDNENLLEQIKAPKVKQTKTGYLNIFGVGISILLANLLGPVMNYFNIQISPTVNFITLILTFLIVIIMRFYLSKVNQKNLCKVVKLEQLQTEKLWIRPKSNKYFFQYLLIYLLFLVLTILGVMAFVEYGNVMMLLFSILFLSCLFIGSGMTVMAGSVQVKFRKDKYAV